MFGAPALKHQNIDITVFLIVISHPGKEKTLSSNHPDSKACTEECMHGGHE